jgi:hypothetical protein
MGLLSLAKKTVSELVDLGYPESVAKKISSGELPMDEASRVARREEQMTPDLLYRGHATDRPPRSDEDMFLSNSPRTAQTYADNRGDVWDEASLDYVKREGAVTPLRTNANNLLEVDVYGNDYTYPHVNVPGYGMASGSDEISRAVKQGNGSTGGGLQGTKFEDMADDYNGHGEPSDVYNILGSYPDVKIRHAENAAFDPDYSGPNIMGGAAGTSGVAGLLAAGQSEDSEAGAGGLLARQILDGFDPRFDPRKNEADRIMDLTTEKLDSGIDVPRVALQDMEGKEFVTSMSDRTDSGGLLTSIKGVELERPLMLRGGQGYMFENPGKVWASGKTPVTQLMNAAGGKDIAFMPWRMAPTGGDFANMTGEAMLSYARSNMTSSQKKDLDKMIGEQVAGWPGVNSDEAVDFWPTISDKMRKKLKNDMDVSFRNDGGLNKGEARLAVTDPDQINARDGGIMNIGTIHGGKPRITNNDHPSYPDAVPGEGVGRTDQDVGILELLPEVVKERGVPDPLNPRATDLRALQMKPYKGRVTDKILKNLEGRGVNIKAVGAPAADPEMLSAQLNNHDEGVDQHMINLGMDPREDPMYDYGTLLPVRENIVTGESEMAMPTILRDMVRGLLDVAESRKSNVFRPDGLLEVL